MTGENQSGGAAEVAQAAGTAAAAKAVPAAAAKAVPVAGKGYEVKLSGGGTAYMRPIGRDAQTRALRMCNVVGGDEMSAIEYLYTIARLQVNEITGVEIPERDKAGMKTGRMVPFVLLRHRDPRFDSLIASAALVDALPQDDLMAMAQAAKTDLSEDQVGN